MSNQEILAKAIQKAIDGGYKKNPGLEGNHVAFSPEDYDKLEIYRLFIFSHAFAKALWPITMGVAYDTRIPESKPLWQHHLQQMVIADDPIKYLGEHI